MACAHKLVRQAGELVYCDSTSSLDWYNCQAFVMSMYTSTGGVPLGVVITSGESEVITEAMKNVLLTKLMSCMEKSLVGQKYISQMIQMLKGQL